MRYREHAPHDCLRDRVKCFWSLERDYGAADAHEEVVPDACVELILNFGSPYVLCEEDRPEREMPAVFVVGLQRRPLRFRCDGTVKLVAARFHAWGALPFLEGDERAALAVSPASDQRRREGVDAIRARVLADDFDGAVARLEEMLIERLLSASIDARRLQAAAMTLQREKGQVRIADLAERCFLSVRQVQRHVRDTTGVSPKTLARAIRFDSARERLMFAPDTQLTALAHECGYADQAHLVREFREFAGKTPGAFAAEMRALQSVLRRPEVEFLPRPSPARR
jgi:AraC-like DNA-binding protein